MNHDILETDNIDDANYVYIVNDHRNLGFTNGRYYKLHDRHGNKYAVDNYGKENHGILNCVKIKLCKVNDSKYIEDLIEEVKQSKITNSKIDFLHSNMTECMFELFEEIKQKEECKLSDREYHFLYSVVNYLDSLEEVNG